MLAGVALLAPRFPRLKEWAYAGLVFNYTGAAASHLAMGDPAVTLVAPIIFTALVVASWALRQSARRAP
jgi:DoxX-like family